MREHLLVEEDLDKNLKAWTLLALSNWISREKTFLGHYLS
jgi:hypothetical protein